MLKSTSIENKFTRALGAVKKAALGVSSLVVAASVAGGCLQRPVEPQDPKTNNVYVDQIRQTAVDKIDLLFMIDNSISMADKQAILADAVPVLVNRLIAPACIDPTTGAQVGTTDANGACATGEAEFNSIKDIHIGVVTSSLGSHGGQVCSDIATNPRLDDHARLVGSIAGLPSWNNTGFLAWDPTGQKNSPPGEAVAGNLINNFKAHVQGAGESGCGYEASLEAWYRFLIDPDPPASVSQQGGATTVGRDANGAVIRDDVLIAQRDAFLRADSLVAIIMLSDENDCSIIDEGQGWLVGLQQNGGAPFQMPRATAICATDPNSACCRSCASDESGGPPAGCGAIATDTSCAMGGSLTSMEDSLNLRCYEQKRRFGFNLLYPTQRYVDGLTSSSVPNRDNVLVENPLFAPRGDKPARDKSLVFLAGIVGVPWQDIADDASLSGAGLNYLTAEQIAQTGRWDMILGNATTPPSDPLMIETPDPRTGTHPLLNVAVAPPSSTSPTANPINGHEQEVGKRDDLQYACIFPLDMPRTCDMNTAACDCNMEDLARNRPLCQPPGGGAASTTQYYAKAYPGVRELQVLKDFGNNAIVASICPKVTQSANPETDANYGYNPAVGAIISRLKEALTGKCLPRTLVPDTCNTGDGNLPGCDGNACEDTSCYNPNYGKVPCAVIEALYTGDGSCDCEAVPGRSTPAEEIRPAVIQNLSETGQCGGAGGQPCADLCLCEINQLTGPELDQCQNVEVPGGIVGYCYVDATQEIGNPALVEKCPATQKRILRFVDPASETPRKGAVTFIACIGATLGG